MPKSIQWFFLFLIVVASFLLMLNSSLKESAIMDELAHIPAGYGYVRFLDYRLNPEHPPLVKVLAGLPLAFQNLNFPTQSKAWQTDINGQWESGSLFLYESGNDADKIVNWARLGPMLLTLLLIIFIYVWAKEVLGRWWAFLPTAFFAFSPAVLAHGHYVTTDLGAAFGFFISIYYFVKFLMKPAGRSLLLAGLAFGIAQLLKFSTVLLLPLFFFLVFAFALWKSSLTEGGLGRFTVFFKELGKKIISLAGIFLIGYILVYLVYLPLTLKYPVEKQRSDTEFILSSFAGGPDQNWEACKINSGAALNRRVRCLADVNVWMSGNKIFRPFAQYMLGVLMVMQRAAGGNTGYFLGEVSAGGWWYYFPVVFLFKEPLPSLILITLSLVLTLWLMGKNLVFRKSRVKNFFNYLGTNFPEFAMLSFIVLYWAYSIKSPLNIGIRHIMPTLPFIYILSTAALKKWISFRFVFEGNFFKAIINALVDAFKKSAKLAFVLVLVAWYLLESFVVSPHFLSYFNQLAGGTENGYRQVTDSNYDWGQDMKYLKTFVEKNNIDKIAVDYFGGGSAKYYLGDKAEGWWSSRGNPKLENIEWLAISINNLQGSIGQAAPGFVRNPADEYRWLQNLKKDKIYEPDAKAGTSIFIYKL